MTLASSEDRKVKRTAKREMNPFEFHRRIFIFLMEESLRRKQVGDPLKREGWYEFKAASIVFIVFWVEAYLNYVLENVFQPVQYEVFERKSLAKKIDLFNEKYSISMNYSVFKPLKDFRDSLAHGKNYNTDEVSDFMELEKFNGMSPNEFSGLDAGLNTKWEEYLDLVDQDDLIEMVSVELEKLRQASGLKFHYMGLGDLRVFGASIE